MPRLSKPRISRESAAKAALAVIDEHGISGFGFRVSGFGLSAVAQRLGVKAPSLYHHLASKEDLLAQVALSLLSEGELPMFAPDAAWVEQIVRICLASWRSVLRHPRAAVLLLQFMPMSLIMGAYEHWAHYLAINRVPFRLHLVILDGTDKLTFGSILFTAQRRMDGSSGIIGMHNDRLPYLSQASAALPISDEDLFTSSIRNVRGVLLRDMEMHAAEDAEKGTPAPAPIASRCVPQA